MVSRESSYPALVMLVLKQQLSWSDHLRIVSNLLQIVQSEESNE